ncbi:MAG: MarR family transcriptional regulator [Desulfopila sp.]|jgi:DNA-binding MarR family transcriptional regulator|nr:MarR family transcriptional regulator [Desulfopila sp.]
MGDRTLHIKSVTRYLRILFKVVQAHSKFVEKECGLSSAKLWMLSELYANPGIKVSQLANSLSIHPSTCSNMLDKLEEDGFVSRERSKKDQRAVHLSMTDKGTELLRRAPQPTQGKLSGALENLSDENLVLLEKGLDQLVQALQENGDDAALLPIAGE